MNNLFWLLTRQAAQTLSSSWLFLFVVAVGVSALPSDSSSPDEINWTKRARRDGATEVEVDAKLFQEHSLTFRF